MVYAKYENPDGAYVDAGGRRYDVSIVRRVRCSRGVNVGCIQLPALEVALEEWGLSRCVVLPQEEIIDASHTAAE